MKFALLTAFCVSISLLSLSQSYTSYFTGDTTDVSTPTSFGLCLMGGATEEDHAMKWFLQHSGGGDIVVLRTSGSNGYNTYLYSQLGVAVNSVETILFNDASAAYDPYVIRQIANAEAIFIAGGDQYTYVVDWRGTPVDSLINYLSAVKKIPVGGTSAGMAILGWSYNSAQNGSVTSAQALANPYAAQVAVEQNNFLHLPFMENTITDTHYDNPDRRGRHVVFLARMIGSNPGTARGIACDEYTAVCIDSTGRARVFGNAPQYDDNAYFLQVNCILPNVPETFASGQPLTWNRGQEAIKVYNIKGDTLGSNWFDAKDWMMGHGGMWQNWFVQNGVLNTQTGTSPSCTPLPAHLISFTGQLQDNNIVSLHWTAINEQSFDRYEIEKSVDGRAFNKIGAVSATGAKNYTFTEHSPFPVATYYRLRLADKDGGNTYSKVIMVKLPGNNKFTIYPNPATTFTQLKLDKSISGKVNIEVLDVTGKAMIRRSFDDKEIIQLPTNQIAAGSYVVKVIADGTQYFQTLIVDK